MTRPAQARVLVVDDEPAILRAVQLNLTHAGYQVDTAATAEEALRHFANRPPDVMILDLGLTDRDGLEVIQQVRARRRTPIIVLSVRGGERDKVAALDLGADDYLTKPFGVAELLARVRVALRHQASRAGSDAPILRVGGLEVDLEQRQVRVDGREVHLTRTEYELLRILVANASRVVTDQMLLEQVWGPQYGDEAHYLHVYVARLRKKIEPDPHAPRFIHTVHGDGYRLA